MGAGGASTGGGGGGVGPAGLVTNKRTGKTRYGTTKDAKKVSKRNKLRTFIKEGGIIGSVTKPFREKSEEINRKFFEEKVKPAGKSKYNTYEDYIKARGRGEVDAYGREITQSDNDRPNNNQPLKARILPVEPETRENDKVVERTLQIEDNKDDSYDIRKTKRKGRRQTILTSQTGATGNLELGKKSLLGV